MRDRERVFQVRHEDAALQVEHSKRRLACEPIDVAPLPHHSRRVIQGTQKPRLIRQQNGDFLLIPKMITSRHDIHASGKNVFSRLGRDAGTARGILAIGDDYI